jgi:hypothetical protein
VGKPEVRRPLGKPRSRWEEIIKKDLQKVGCGGSDCIELAQDRDRWRALANAVNNLRVPLNAGNFLTSCKPVSFSRMILLHEVRNAEDGISRLIRNGSTYLPDYTASHSRNHISNSAPGKLVTHCGYVKNVSQHIGIGTQFFNTFRIFCIYAIRTQQIK